MKFGQLIEDNVRNMFLYTAMVSHSRFIWIPKSSDQFELRIPCLYISYQTHLSIRPYDLVS